jgi:hypothetical protein
MRTANLVAAVIVFALGAACLAFAFRQERRLRLLDTQRRTAPAANYRTLRLFGFILLSTGASGIYHSFYGPN